jgi:FixJ family two-component response regulator
MVILDVKVGGEGGSSMTVAAMLSEQGTPFVFLTGLRAEEVKVGAFAAVPVVEKPYQATTLIEALRGALTPA